MMNLFALYAANRKYGVTKYGVRTLDPGKFDRSDVPVLDNLGVICIIRDWRIYFYGAPRAGGVHSLSIVIIIRSVSGPSSRLRLWWPPLVYTEWPPLLSSPPLFLT